MSTEDNCDRGDELMVGKAWGLVKNNSYIVIAWLTLVIFTIVWIMTANHN